MVKSVAARKGKGRKSRGRATRSRRQSSFPPVIPFDKVFLNMVMRQTQQVESQPINSHIEGAISIKGMFDGIWSHLRDCFSQVWIVKVTVYIMAGVGYDEPGYHLINMAPKNEFDITAGTKFVTLASLPGTRTARITRMVSGTWRPTGMDERMWFKTDSNAVLFEYFYKSSCQKSGGTATASYPVEITVDYHVKLRGINYRTLAESNSDDGLDAEFVSLSTC